MRQLGRLILMTQVPAGAFTINDVPIVSGNSDLEVQVIAASGERQQFVVPAASFGNVRNVAPQGLSAAVGRYQASRGSDSRTPLVATVSNGWSLGSRSTLNAGVLVSAPYRALAAGVSVNPSDALSASIGVRASSASFAGEKLQGQQITANLSATPVERLSTSLSATLQTEGYRDLAQVVQAPRPDARILPSASQTYTAGVSWFSPTLGAFSAAYTTSRLSRQEGKRNRATLSWNRSFARTSVSLSMAKDLSTGTRARSENQYFLTLSFPWAAPAPAPMSASQAIAAVLALLTRHRQPAVQLQRQLERRQARRRGQFVGIDRRDAALRARQPVRQPGFARRRVDELGVQGSVVGAGGAVAFSPYEVGDTFGIAKVGDLGGVEIQTPSGPVWTDAWGNAVIPGLTAYGESSVEISTASLPRNANLPNGVQSVKPARGSVQVLDFNLRQVQRYLLSAVLETDRQPLAERLPVMDGRGNLVTLVGRQGQIFLDDDYPAPLQVTLQDGSKCYLEFTPEGKPDPDRPYQDALAVCRKLPPGKAAS